MLNSIIVADNVAARDIGGFGYGIDQNMGERDLDIDNSIFLDNIGPTSFIGNPKVGNIISDFGSTNFAIEGWNITPPAVVRQSIIGQ